MSTYNRQLRHWLARIAGSTSVVWGESDWVVTPDYGRAYATLIPDARCETIAAAGHHPEIEPPEELAALVGSFSG
jgi:pimeloyl-ACP methyl ester carboxylesterase